MKKVFITLGVLILVVITALMVIPTFFKGDILQIIEKQSAKYINAKLKIGDMNLSMFISFPNLNVALKEVMITGQDEFAGDTVVFNPVLAARKLPPLRKLRPTNRKARRREAFV